MSKNPSEVTPAPSSAPDQPDHPEQWQDKPYTIPQLREELARIGSTLDEQPLTKEDGTTYLEKLYAFLKHVGAIDNKTPNISTAKKHLDTSLIFTEIARARVGLFAGDRSRLSNTRELSRWHQESSDFLRDTVRLYGEDKSRAAIVSYWQEQEAIFTNQFQQTPSHTLRAEFERHKSGVLAAVAFEDSLRTLEGWRIKHADPKLDAGRAIDYVLESLDGNIFLVQLTSTQSPSAPIAECRMMTSKKPKNISDKETRFWRGVNSYVPARKLDPEKVKAVFITLSQRYIDDATGTPNQTLRQELTKSLDAIDAKDIGWSDSNSLSFQRIRH
ncbi:MAG: hypothetical protein Q8P73_03950 [bacterium]|nr:hypothetical protein [bacterium]